MTVSNTVQVFHDVLSADDLEQLRHYFYRDDGDLDQRPDVSSKNPDPDSRDWPSQVIRGALDRMLPDPYCIEEALFHKSNFRYNLHADTGKGHQSQPLYKAILFPLELQGSAGTTFFRNHWHGPSAKFTKEPYRKWKYSLPNRHGTCTEVDDIRITRQRALAQDTELSRDFVIDQAFLDMLDHLVKMRDSDSTNSAGRAIIRHVWIADYSEVDNINDRPFPEQVRQAYCQHIAAQDLHGLTFDTYVPWQPGSAIVFDRTQIHCTGNGDLGKLGLTVFTDLA